MFRFIASLLWSSPVAPKFPEEPLTMTQEQGYGYFPGYSGLILKDGRYKVIQKLGFGQYSSTWLVEDTQSENRRHYAIKVLTAYATQVHDEGGFIELELLQTIQSLQTSFRLSATALPALFDHFELAGPHGKHLCFVVRTLCGDISSFRRSSPTKTLPCHTVQLLTAEVLGALRLLHEVGIVHTDLKPTNVLFDSAPSTVTDLPINALSPATAGDFELYGQRYPIVLSQPIPHNRAWDDDHMSVELYSVVLNDLGNGQWTAKPMSQAVTSYALRAPEIILGSGFDEKIDIWALGCMVFELLTGRWLFHPKDGKTWRMEDDHLAKMLEITGDIFSESMLSRCKLRDDFFTPDGKLRRIIPSPPMSLEQAIANYNVVHPDDIGPAAAFIRACLRLDPAERASAAELDDHEWLAEAEMVTGFRAPA